MTILDTIAEKTKERIEAKKREISPETLKKSVTAGEGGRLERALEKSGMSFICEIKKASPSKGVIAQDFPYLQIAAEYEKAGADAISVLTEPFYFQGCDEYLRQIRRQVSIPILRKDFTVDEYMIYQAREMGADAILLICSILSPMQLSEYLGIAGELGLSALVETHDETEVEMALSAGAKILGVNNRNLKDFTVDVNHSAELRSLVPENVLFVAESGMKTRADIAKLEEAGVNGVLIGETLMRSASKKQTLAELAGKTF